MMGEAPLRDDILVSVCLTDIPANEPPVHAVRQLADRLAQVFRYWELIVAMADDVDPAVLSLLRAIPNMRLLKMRHGTPFYRRRSAVANEAIGDVVVLAAFDELATLDVVKMIDTAQSEGVIVIGERAARGALYPGLRTLGRSAGFRVNPRSMLTMSFPRTLLNQLLAHTNPPLALRFPPAETAFPIQAQRAHGRAQRRITPKTLGRRILLLQKLLISSAPNVLNVTAVLSVLLTIAALSYLFYAVFVLFLVPNVQPGWFSTSVLLGGMTAFLGLAVFGISIGLQKALEYMAGSRPEDIVGEISSLDLFGHALHDLNVELDSTRNSAGQTPTRIQ